MLEKIVDKIVYSITKKPKYCVEVKNPPKTAVEKLARSQDSRQVQYNRWSRRYKVYSGSYLPRKPEDLEKKGWVKKRVSDNKHYVYQRKSTNQTVRHDGERINKDGTVVPSHWHWLVWWRPYFGDRTRRRFNNAKNSEKIYYNRYGEKTNSNRTDYHIDKDVG